MIPNRQQLGIVSAKNRSVQESAYGGPNMSSTIKGLMRPLRLVVVRKSVVDREVQEVEEEHYTQGVLVPLSGAKLEMKPEGQRSWNWSTLYANADLVLRNDDVVIYRGVRNRVMRNSDFSAQGYMEYDLVSAYEVDNAPRL